MSEVIATVVFRGAMKASALPAGAVLDTEGLVPGARPARRMC